MSNQIATFYIGDTLLGLEILWIKEIYRHAALTMIPGAQDHLAGLLNLRGKIITVIDINVCLNHPKTEEGEEKRLLILKTDSELHRLKQTKLQTDVHLGEDVVGFLINRMGDVMSVEDADILPPPPNLDAVEKHLINGVVKLDGRLIILLDTPAVLEEVAKVTGGVETEGS